MNFMETILKIENLETGEHFSEMAGYKITTDEQEIELLIDSFHQCCENWGYFWCNDDIDYFIGAGLLNISVVNTALDKKILDKKFDEYMDPCMMFVNIETTVGILQFVAYNDHNGYYGHTAKIISKQLKHEEYL